MACTSACAGAHLLKLTVRDRAGNQAVFEGVHEWAAAPLPTDYALHRNYPNPFNAGTVVPYDVPGGPDSPGTTIHLCVYNATGQLTRVLVDELAGPGRHAVLWDGRDERGVPVSSGVYLYRLSTTTTAHVRRVTILK